VVPIPDWMSINDWYMARLLAKDMDKNVCATIILGYIHAPSYNEI
jgi:hypothetical protein